MKNLNRNTTIFEFKEEIKQIEDFPNLEDFLIWAHLHRTNLVSAFNYLIYLLKKYKKL